MENKTENESYDNKRKFEIMRDMNVPAVMICSTFFAIDVVASYLMYASQSFYGVILLVVYFTAMRFITAYVCVNYLRPRIYGSRAVAFTYGWVFPLLGVIPYWIFTKLVEQSLENKEGTPI